MTLILVHCDFFLYFSALFRNSDGAEVKNTFYRHRRECDAQPGHRSKTGWPRCHRIR